MIRRLLNIVLVAIAIFSMASCKQEPEIWDYIPLDEAYDEAQKLEAGLSGAYYTLGNYRFLGKYAICIGDFAGDLATASASSGHFLGIHRYNVTETQDELSEIWNYGYKVIDRCVRLEQGANALLASKPEVEDEIIAYKVLYQGYALRALSNFYLVNIFALPYRAGAANASPGIVIVKDAPVEAFAQVSRSTVAEVYAHIDECIKKANEYYDKFMDAQGEEPNAFYINKAGLLALEARVALYKGDWATAATCASKPLDGRARVNDQTYQEMWRSIALTDEIIFAIAKSEDDNLSANSINTQYGSYGGRISSTVTDLMADTDIRKRMVAPNDDNATVKWLGLSTSAATSNIPIFRTSEMYLIMAEAKAQQDDLAGAKTALLFTAQRDASIASEADLPSTKEALLDFIEEERIRELYSEGHRWYDARRTNRPTRYRATGYAWNVSGFCYPIPSSEVNAGFGVEQNANWSKALPALSTKANAVSYPITSLQLERDSVKMGDSIMLVPVVKPFYASEDLTWESGTAAVATVKDGMVKGLTIGKSIITVSTKTGVTASCEITVKDSTTYAITVASGIANGKVSVKPSKAAADDIVKLTVTPADGYRLKEGSLKAYKKDDSSVEVTISKNQFIMPAYAVEVTAQFEAVTPAP